MAYFTHHNEEPFEIDFNKYKAVFVLATFNRAGEIRPDMLRFENPDQSMETLKIIKVSSRKPITGGFLFTCQAQSYGIIKQFKLAFFIKQHIWALETNA